MNPLEKPPQRIGKLDSVRGIAALMVLIGHCGGLSLFGLTELPQFRWLHFLWDGEAAVVMFFLLSGFVLALQLDSPRRPTFPQYLLRRFTRIWPAFAVTVIIAFGVFRWTGIPVDAGAHHGGPRVPDWVDLAKNLVMAGHQYAIDPPVWSLYVEARLSLLFPLLYLLARRASEFWAAAVSVVLSILLSRMIHWDLPHWFISLAESCRYLFLFVMGAVLAKPGNTVEIFYGTLRPPAKATLAVLALGFLMYSFLPAHGQIWPLAGYVRWLGMGLVFVFCLYSKRAEGLLNNQMLLFLGRVSYGVYLVHFPIMLGMKQLGLFGLRLTAVVLAASLFLSWCINKWVEQPMINLGKKLSARI